MRLEASGILTAETGQERVRCPWRCSNCVLKTKRNRSRKGSIASLSVLCIRVCFYAFTVWMGSASVAQLQSPWNDRTSANANALLTQAGQAQARGALDSRWNCPDCARIFRGAASKMEFHRRVHTYSSTRMESFGRIENESNQFQFIQNFSSLAIEGL